jgi:hypothetical protein
LPTDQREPYAILIAAQAEAGWLNPGSDRWVEAVTRAQQAWAALQTIAAAAARDEVADRQRA